MNNFNLHTPTRILFGKGAIAGLREQIPHDARVLITYGGGSVKKTGVLDQVLDALKGMDVLEFGGLLGSGPVMKVNTASPARFIRRGGRIPAPLQSLKN